MFIGMVKETSKDKKWSKGSKESAEGQGKAIQAWFTWSGKISYNTIHLNCTLCFTICYKCLTIWAKSGTNLRTKFIVPMNDCIPFLLWGKGICSIDLILSGSMEIPFLETTWPSSFPSITTNTHFLGFSEMLYFRQRSKICFRCQCMFFSLLWKYRDIINITTTLRPIKPWKSMSMALWKVAPALMIPKGILL